VKNPPHGRLRHAQRLEASQQVADASCPVLGMFRPHRHDGFTSGVRCPRSRHQPRPQGREALLALEPVRLHPVVDGLSADAEVPRDVQHSHAPLDFFDYTQLELERVTETTSQLRLPLALPLPATHPSVPFLPAVPVKGGQVLGESHCAHVLMRWRAPQR
jgi:hypothetical protein